MTNYQYAYFVGVLLFLPIYLFFWIRRRDLRKQMLFLSLLMSMFGFTEVFFYGEYWSPVLNLRLFNINVGLESVALCFLYGGITSCTYEIVFGKRLIRKGKKARTLSLPFIGVSIALTITAVLVLKSFLPVNIIYLFMIVQYISAAVLYLLRTDLVIPGLINASIFLCIVMTVLFIFRTIFPGIFEAWWNLKALSGIMPLGIPLEEYLWHFSIGLLGSPIYELWKGYRIK